MTVKCLSQGAKQALIAQYRNKLVNQTELALKYGVSERTVNRVLIEAGLATPVPRLKGEAYQVMQVLKKHHIEPENLNAVLMDCGHAPTDQQLVKLLASREFTDIITIFDKACSMWLRQDETLHAD